jgi:virulence factor Mce-like protein
MIRLWTALVRRFGRGTLIFTALGLVVAVAAGLTVYFVFFDEDDYQITARFTATPGLYPGNGVDILGVPTGEIVSVTPRSGYVDVVMSLPTNVKIPANAKAVMVAPNPVSDRFVQLTPAYVKGEPDMKAGHVIGLADTVVPLELDSIYANIDDLSKTLGPGGANAHGELSAVLHSFADLINGKGTDLHATIDKIAAALPALTAHPNDLKNLITGLDQLTTTLAAHDATINSLYDDLNTATGQLADERSTISAAISNLQQGLAEVADFIKANQAHIGSSVKNLNTTIAAVMAEQKSLIQTFDTAPLGFQNFNRAIDPNAPCITAKGDGGANNCTALWGRLDTTADVAAFVKQYCGTSVANPLLPIVLSNLKLAKASATDTACGAQIGLLQGRTGPPGSPKTPDLDLTHYLGSR